MSVNIEDFTFQLIDEAEALCGQSIGDWTFQGLEIKDAPPSLIYYPETGNITISLSKKVLEDNLQLVFQLSHEVCHLLHPSLEYPSLIRNSTLVINEGLSTYFSLFQIRKHFVTEYEIVLDNLKTFSKNYFNAYKLVSSLINSDSEAIRKLRKAQPRIDKLTLSDFSEAKVEIDSEFKLRLLQSF